MLGFWYGRTNTVVHKVVPSNVVHKVDKKKKKTKKKTVHKVSDDCALRGVYKLRKNETLWAPLIASSLAQERDAADRNLGLFADSLKVLDPLFFER